MTNFVEQEIKEQPTILRTIADNFAEPLQSEEFPATPTNIVVTGCGDSLCAAMAGEYFFEKAGLSARAVHAMDLSRHRKNLLKDAVLVAISVSGRTRRIIEVVKIARRMNTPVVVLTDDVEASPLGKEGFPISIQASQPEDLRNSSYKSHLASQYVGYAHDVPQTKTYTANLATLYLLASIWGNQLPLNSAIDELRHTAQVLEENPANNPQQCEKWAKKHSGIPFFCCGSGPNLATARYASYKLYEYCLPAHLGTEIEEFCHTQYFLTQRNDIVVFLAQTLDDFNRVEEIAYPLKEDLGLQPLVITQESHRLPGIDSIHISESGSFIQEFFELTESIQWLTLALALINGRDVNTFRGGIETELYIDTSYKTIRQSKILTDE